MSSQQVNDKRYFNLHLEGFANLYDARWIRPKPGQSFEPFLQVRAVHLQGKHDNAEPLFIDFKVTGAAAKRIIEHFMDSISDEAQKVSAVVKSGDIRITPKMHNGEPRVFVGARLLTVKYLKVNGEQIALEPFQGADGEGRVADMADYSQKRQPQQEQEQRSESLPMRVKLEKNAPDFAQRKAELKAAGYRWDRDNFEWTLAPREQASA